MKTTLKIMAFGLGGAILTAVCVHADIVTTSTMVYTGQVIRVGVDGLTVRVPAGDITLPVAQVVSVEVPMPVAVLAAKQAMQAKDYQGAIKILKPWVDQLGGLQVDWMEDTILLLGDAYAAIPDAANARKIYDLFKQLYPQSPKASLVDGKFARILVEQKKYADALPLLQKFLDPLLAKQSISEDEEQAVAESLLLLGDCQRATGKPDAALDSYLTIVTLFDVEPAITYQARQRAAEIFEMQKRWPRAKQMYQELLAAAPPANVADDAKKKLAALNEAHPE